MGVSTRTEIKNATRQYKNTVVWRKGLLAENPQITVFEKADYPRKDNSNYPYSFFSNLLPLLISAIGKLNKINISFENRRVFGVFTMWENKKALGYGRSPHISRLNFFLLDANQFYLFQDNNVCPLQLLWYLFFDQ